MKNIRVYINKKNKNVILEIDESQNNYIKNIEYIIKTPKKSVIPRSEKLKKYVRA